MFLFLELCFLASNILSESQIPYLIKTQRWEKLEELFQNKTPSKESEVFAFIEYYSKSPKKNPEARFRMLLSLIKGSFVSVASSEEIKAVVQAANPNQSVPYKLSYWKLYEELVDRNLLDRDSKIQYLQKLERANDPISRKALAEIVKLYSEDGRHRELVDFVKPLVEDRLQYLVSSSIQVEYAKSLNQLGEKEKSREELLKVLRNAFAPFEMKKIAGSEFKKLSSTQVLEGPIGDELALMANYLGDDDKKRILQNPRWKLSSKSAYKELSLLFARRDRPDLVSQVLENQESLIKNDSDFHDKLGEILFSNKDFKTIIKLFSEVSSGDTPNLTKWIALASHQLGDNRIEFENLLKSLTNYPYNLTLQDKLIESLVQIDSDSVRYGDLSLFKRAVKEMPNLPVKGRLVYWYLRALEFYKETATLEEELDRYYEYCPGSFYTRVIRTEFDSIISRKPEVENPTKNRQEFIRYLSQIGGDGDKAKKLWGKNLNFLYSNEIYELGNRLQYIQNRILANRLLTLAAEYMKFGEDKLAVSLVDEYIRDSGSTEIYKEEVLVGLGDLTSTTYYSLYYTRSLMKRMKLADDPILLPTSIASRLYPRPHRDLVQKFANEYNVEENVIYAVMRQESFFRETVVSRSNAQGLMQIMPATGKEIARNLRIPEYSLFMPLYSIRMGTKFLEYLLKSNENDLRWATIAYNGGPGNLRKWKRNHYRGNFYHFLEELPVKESRDYCRIVVSNSWAYDSLAKFHKL